jgi:hypothetical protein
LDTRADRPPLLFGAHRQEREVGKIPHERGPAAYNHIFVGTAAVTAGEPLFDLPQVRRGIAFAHIQVRLFVS